MSADGRIANIHTQHHHTRKKGFKDRIDWDMAARVSIDCAAFFATAIIQFIRSD